MTRVTAGFLDLGGRKTWYRSFGGPTDKAALLMLHGGPGACSPDEVPFVDVVARDRQVVQYDQIDTGRSPKLGNVADYTVERHVEQVEQVRDALGLDEVHVWGQSWGGMLALAYALEKPNGLRSVTVASGPHAARNWVAAAEEYRAALPPATLRAMQRCEGTIVAKGAAKAEVGKGADPAALRKQAAMMAKVLPLMMSAPAQAVGRALSYVPPLRNVAYQVVGMPFVARHVYRARPISVGSLVGIAGTSTAVYNHMWGPSESVATGVLRDFDLTERLHEINVPVLVTSGGHECVRPADVEALLARVPQARWELFEECAHCSEYEEPARYTRVLTEFLTGVEGPGAA